MMSIAYLLIGWGLYFLSWLLTKDKLQPIGLAVLLWFSMASLSSFEPLYNPLLQSSWGFVMHALVILSGLSLFIPALFFYGKQVNFNYTLRISKTFRIIFVSFAALSLIAFIIRFRGVLFSPALLSIGGDLKQNVPKGIPFIHYFDLLTPFLSITALFQLLFSFNLTSRYKKFLLFYIVFSIVIAILYKVSRGELLVQICGSLYLLCKSPKINNKKLFGLGCLILMCLVSLTAIRISSGSLVSSQFGDNALGLIFSPIYTYVAMSFENLNKLSHDQYHNLSFIWGSLSFALRMFYSGEYDDNSLGLNYHETLFFNAKTFAYDFYMDLGLLGVFIYPLMIGLVIQMFYHLASRNVVWILQIAFMQKAIIFLFFGNYFFSELVILFPYLVCLLFILSNLKFRKSIS